MFCEASIFSILRWGWGTCAYLPSKCQNQSVHSGPPSPKAQAPPPARAVPASHASLQRLSPALQPTGVAPCLPVGILASFKALFKCSFFHEASMGPLLLSIDLPRITHSPSYIQESPFIREGTRSQTPRGCLKPQTVLHLIYSMFSYAYTPMIKLNL